MTTPFEDTYLIDGWDLGNAATSITTAEGLQDTPGQVGENVGIAALDGEFDPYADPAAPRRPLGAGSITFDLSLKGVDPVTGVWLGDTDSAGRYFALWDDLVRRFHRRSIVVAHPRADGTTRTTPAHLGLGAISPSREPSSPWFGRARFPLVIPGGVWEDGTVVDTGLVTRASGATLDLSGFATATAPCPCSVRFGSGNNPALALNSRVFAWDAVIAAGRQMLYDPTTGLTSQGSGSAWTPGYTPALRYTGSARGFEVDPSDASQLAVITTTGGSVQVQVAGKRLYRTS